MKLKSGDPKTKVKSSLTAIVWKDKRNVNIMMNMHSTPLDRNFCDEDGKAVKPAIIQDYNRHKGNVNNSDCMTKSYSISRQIWKWTKMCYSSIFSILPFSTAVSFSSLVVKNYHTNNVD
jgi:hypothetical protein